MLLISDPDINTKSKEVAIHRDKDTKVSTSWKKLFFTVTSDVWSYVFTLMFCYFLCSLYWTQGENTYCNWATKYKYVQ